MSQITSKLVLGSLRWVGSLKWCVAFAKEPYKRDYIMQKRPMNVLALVTRALASFQKTLVALFEETAKDVLWFAKQLYLHHLKRGKSTANFIPKDPLKIISKEPYKIIFKRALQTKEASPTCPFWIATSHFKEPTNHSYPIVRVSQEPKHS